MGPAFVPCSAQIRHKVLEENTWVVHILRSKAQKTKETEGEKGRWQVPRKCPAGVGTHTLFLIEEDPLPMWDRPPRGPQQFLRPSLSRKCSHPSLA